MTKEGKTKWVEDKTQFRRDESGRITHFQGVVEDITVRKETDAALQASEERFKSLFKLAPVAIAISDPNGRFLDMNDSHLKMFGYTKEELLHKPSLEMLLPEDRESVKELAIGVRDGKREAYAVEKRFLRKDGRFGWGIIRGTAVRDDAGQIVYWIGIAEDITELKIVQEELARHRDQLEDLVQERTRELETAQDELLKRERLSVLGQLTATVSHELRNPLGVIRSSAYYLQKKIADPDEKTSGHFRRIDDQVSRCDAIVEDLLEYTRGRHAERRVGDINAWLGGALEQMDLPEGVVMTRELFHD
ncbi:MAG: PAS domain S-box protein, partial [Deltaproteobacteria bacterium]|nr:PAS domain S-box protein [Deltaproteobacteria bacterium]